MCAIFKHSGIRNAYQQGSYSAKQKNNFSRDFYFGKFFGSYRARTILETVLETAIIRICLF